MKKMSMHLWYLRYYECQEGESVLHCNHLSDSCNFDIKQIVSKHPDVFSNNEILI